MIDQSGALRDESVACSVQHLQILLLSRLHWHKPHGRTQCGLVDRLRIDRVILRAFDERHNEAWVNKTNRESHRLETTPPMMSAGTGLHGNASGGKFLNGGLKF